MKRTISNTKYSSHPECSPPIRLTFLSQAVLPCKDSSDWLIDWFRMMVYNQTLPKSSFVAAHHACYHCPLWKSQAAKGKLSGWIQRATEQATISCDITLRTVLLRTFCRFNSSSIRPHVSSTSETIRYIFFFQTWNIKWIRDERKGKKMSIS